MLSEREIQQRIVGIKDRIQKLEKLISDEMMKHFSDRNMRFLSFVYRERVTYKFALSELERIIGQNSEKAL